MNFLVGVIDKAKDIYHWVFDEQNRTIEGKRKRIAENNENISPKRLKVCHSQTQTDQFSKGDIHYSSRSGKIQSMTKFYTHYTPWSKTYLRAPQSWDLSMDHEVIEFSSDDDDESNDVQVIGEEPPKNRNPLSSLQENGSSSRKSDDNAIEVLKVVKKGKEVPQNGSQMHTSFQTSTPSLSTSHRKNGRISSSSMKKDVSNIKNRTIEKSRVHTLNIAIQMESKEKYGALLNSLLGNSLLYRTPSSSFANMRDLEKKLQEQHCNSKLKQDFQHQLRHKTSTPEVKFIDLKKPIEMRKPTHLPVKPSHTNPNDDDSDVEFVSITPVPRVNSYEDQIRSSKYVPPEWIVEMKESWNKRMEDAARQFKEQQVKKDFYAKRNQQQIDAVEERVRRYMTITDTVVLDEEVEDEEEKLPVLTPEMEKRISAALVPRPPTEVVAEGFSLRITRKDMQTLAKLNWLNDEVINFYMNLLIERGKKDKMPKVYAFNTFFYPTLIDRGYTSLRRWTRKIDIFAHDLIVVPVHLGVHWCVAIIDFREKVVEYYDSMGHPNNKCLNALLKYLQDESIDKKNTPYDISSWKTKNMTDIPQQMNGSDCGMFACTFAEYKCRNAKITFSQADMPYFRRKMVYEILTGCLLM